MVEYVLNGKRINIWAKEFIEYHSKSITEYIRDNLLKFEKEGVDPFNEIVGKEKEKEMIKNALLSGSSILFSGKKGYGKTTFAKAIAKLLPEKILAVKGCKINCDPVNPVCFSCKKKLESGVVEVEWVKPRFVRICGDPMMTTRQLIGGISLQKLKEGYDLDHPEVFTPGRILKANRGIAYVDELGAIPSALQTLLHELLEEKQITTPEGDIIPMKIDLLFIASTNPANYRGVSDIKEPLLDRMEEIPINPPKSIEEEVEIALKNMNGWLKESVTIPLWHLKILARTVVLARGDDVRLPASIDVEPSCRATIKIFDHVSAEALRKGHRAVMLSDYGQEYGNIKLGMRGRIKVDWGEDDAKTRDEVIERLVEEAIDLTCSELTSNSPEIVTSVVSFLKRKEVVNVYEIDDSIIAQLVSGLTSNPCEYKSAFEFVMECAARCLEMAERVGDGVYKYAE